jgi:hypothetical protein
MCYFSAIPQNPFYRNTSWFSGKHSTCQCLRYGLARDSDFSTRFRQGVRVFCFHHLSKNYEFKKKKLKIKKKITQTFMSMDGVKTNFMIYAVIYEKSIN